METKKVHLGLDLGIASVGWSLVDSEQNIIAMGSHLFDKASAPDGKDKYGEGIRGEKRRARRIGNRKKQRKLDFLNMIDQFCYNNQIKLKAINKISSLYKSEYQKIFGFNETESATDFLFHKAHQYDFYKIYREGFERELSPKELFLFLYQKLGNRGTFFQKYQGKKIDEYSYDDSLFKNFLLDKYFSVRHKFRDQSNRDNSFSIFWNWLDIEFILRKCSYINENFIEDYKNIFFRHRHFAHGPGWSKPLSPWSVDYDENRNPIGHIWDKKIGFCPISLLKNDGDESKAQRRLNQFYFAPELADLISQLANTRINNEKLTSRQIIKILNQSIFNDEDVTIQNISLWLEQDPSNFSSYPTGRDQITDKFQKNLKIREYFKKNKKIIEIESINNFDIVKLIDVLLDLDEKRFKMIAKYWEKNDNSDSKDKKDDKNKEEKTITNSKNNMDIEKSIYEIKEILKEIKFDFKINYDYFVDFNNIKESDLSGTREFGIDVYTYYLNVFFNQKDLSKNFDSLNVFYKEEKEESEKYKYIYKNDSKYLSKNMFAKQEFLSPNAKNTLKESIKVINDILRIYIYKNSWFLESIILETTWEEENLKESLKESIKSKKQKKRIIEYQEYMDKEYKNAEADEELKKIKKTINKIDKKKYLLWKMQGCMDFYKINKSLLLSEIDEWQIDHIIPKSISFNSNLENLVVTMSNSEKGNKIPSSFLSSKDFNNLKNNLWKTKLNPEDQDKKNKKKKKNERKELSILDEIKLKKFKFLTMENLDKYKVGFINSNLAETTYAIRKLKEGLEFFVKNFNKNFENNKREKILSYNPIEECDIRTISGQHSQEFRKWIKLETKNRDIKTHHAHDASIIALYSSLPKINNWYKWWNKNKFKIYYWIKANKDDSDKKNSDKKWLEIDLNYVKKVFCGPKNSFAEKILNPEKFWYSFKDYKLSYNEEKMVKKLDNKFYKLPINEQQEKIKLMYPKQIFSNENFNGYTRKKLLLNLFSKDKKEKKGIFNFFKEIYLNEKKGNSIDDYCKNNILTSSSIIKSIYNLIDKDLFLKNYRIKVNIIENITNKLRSNLSAFYEYLNIDTDDINEKNKYLNKILDHYILIIENNQILKINKIDYLDKNKYEVIHLKLLSADDSKKEQVFNFFKNIHQKYSTKESIEEYLRENVITDSDIINEIYEKIDKNLLSKSTKNAPDIIKDVNNKLENNLSIFYNLIESDTNINLDTLKNKDEYLKILLKNYFLIIRDNKLLKISKIKYISEDKYIPTYELADKKYETKSSKNKYVFNKEKQLKLSHNQTLYGEAMKMIALLRYKNKKGEEEIKFFKINQLNKIVRAPEKYEIIKLINPNIWYYYKNEIWKITNLNIKSNLIKIKCLSNKINAKELCYNSDWGELEGLFNKIIRRKE